jgi:DNA-directed RNA polymerase specialized sigma24 family protein
MQRETEHDVLAAIGAVAIASRLTPRQRAAVALVGVLGLTQQEAAACLGIGQSAVAMRLRRARQRAAARCR